MRGRRLLPVDIITRPRELISKQGKFYLHILYFVFYIQIRN
jgi:hypothetical protein